MIPIRFGPQVCGQLAEGTSREWLVPDGLGGYAMGTVSGLRTRRYHGLLMMSGETPAARRLAVASLDPVVIFPSGARVRLATHEWADGTVDPHGYALLEGFELRDGLPRWRWRTGDVVIERELALGYGRRVLGVVHRLVSGPPVTLAVEALVTWRDGHGERYASGPPLTQEPTADGAVFEGAYRLAGPGWEPAGRWYLGVRHREEAARGLQPTEDLWYAGSFRAPLALPGDMIEVWAGEVGASPEPASEIVAAARCRAQAVVAAARPADDVEATLVHAADAFVIATPAGPDVAAGYPWFGAWSRDTMISYEGLFLATGRVDEGRALLRAYAGTLSEGMLANTADTGHTEYNTVDATLWFLHAVERYVTVTGDTDLAAELRPALCGVVDAHLAGTRFGIKVDPADGLVTQGADGQALTWMDARVDGVPVTARRGKPVEVNALWVNGLTGLARGDDRLTALATTARESFRRRYPAPAGWLYDVLDGPGGDDDALRPNQLLAWSLPYAPMDADPLTVRKITAALVTPIGPRSLAPESPGFRGTHRGGPAERDSAYHQGTVWPWLIGPLAGAVLTNGGEIGDLFFGIESHLPEFGLGSVSETADGQPPHAATGCPFQAWSVAEALRARRF